MAFFRNETVNLLNLHYGIHALALSGGGAFFSAYLLDAGVPAPAVLAAYALILAARFAVRPLLLMPAGRWGMKPLVIGGTVLAALQFPLLAEVHGVGWELLALCAVAAVGDTVYWTSYHAYFAALGDAEHRGHQLGAREAIVAMVGIVGPLLTGWALATLGPRIAFGATAAVILVAAPGVLMFAADGWIAASYVFVWQIALFLSLGESFTAYGGAMALAALVGAASGLVLGRLIDAGHGRRAVWLACAALVAVIGLRAAAYASPLLAVAANAAGDADDRGLQSGQGGALHPAISCRHRRRLGRGRGERMPARGRSALVRCADLARDPARAAGDCGGFRAAVALLRAPRPAGVRGGRRGRRPADEQSAPGTGVRRAPCGAFSCSRRSRCGPRLGRSCP
jgi:MFS family permease